MKLNTWYTPLERELLHLKVAVLLLLSALPSQTDGQQLQNTQQDCMMEWLISVGIDEDSADCYYSTFTTEMIDQVSLKLLTLENLKDVGVSAMGHRVLIQCAAVSGSHDTCRNDGSCNYSASSGSFQCSCPSGFSGNRCQLASGGCTNNPCKNGGNCSLHGDNNISCSCPTEYYGDLCQHESSQHNSLIQTVADLSNEVAMLRKTSENSAFQIADTMRRSTGLRFFKLWMELDLVNIIFIRHFMIESRSFLGVISVSTRQVHSGVVIYELVDSERLVHVQTISCLTCTSFKAFCLHSEYYMVVGHHYDHTQRDPPRVFSELYLWNGTMFVITDNQIRTMGIKDVDHVTLPDNSTLIALGAHDDKTTFNVPTYIYRHHPTRGNHFHHFSPNLRTTGALRVNFYTFNSTTYLFVAEERSATGDTRATSSIFRWNSSHFELFQEIKTDAASDLLPFSIEDNFFVVAVNNRRGQSRNIQSIVYILYNGEFVYYYALDTKGATKAEFFRIGIESFLAFSNSQDDSNGSASTDSVIYRVEGAKFVCFQNIRTHNAVYIHVFTLENGCTVLAVANKAGKSRLYKWTSIGFKEGSESS